MYLAYLKANHEELLESEWHHAEAEMAHALAEATRRWHLCDMDITVQYITETPIPASKGVALHPFWEAWTKYKDQINTRTPQERLDFYNLVLVNLCNNFIDLAAKKDVYMPHQMYLMPCNLTEAGAEGK